MTTSSLASVAVIPVLPFAPANRERARSVVVGVGVLGSTIATFHWVRLLDSGATPDPLQAVILAPTAVLMTLFLYVATRPARTKAYGLARMALGLPFGALNGMVIVAAMTAFGGVPREIGTLVVCAAIFGAVVAVPYVLALSLLVNGWLTFEAHRTHEAGDRIWLRSGGWLTEVALVCFAFGAWELRPHVGSSLAGQLWVLGPSVVTGVVGIFLLARAWFRLRGRERWLAAVRAGRITNWEIVPIGTVQVARLDTILHVSARSTETPSSVLAWVTPSEAAYRDAGQRVPMALVA